MSRRVPPSALAALVLSCACISACSGGSGSEDLRGDVAVRQLTCAPGDMIATAAGSLLNNQWNAASAGGGKWKQCLVSQQRPDGTTDHGWSWHWPTKDGLYAYPEILVGGSPWSDTPSNDGRFPRTVVDTGRLQVSYEVESRFTGKNNLALEFWFTDPKAAPTVTGRPPVKAELMIWSDESDGLIPTGDTPVDTVAIDGMTWTVYLHRDWGEVGVTNGQRWAYIAYHAGRRATSANVDARKFFDDAIARGVIAPTDLIAGVELGNELVSGSGVTWIRHFSLALP